MLRSKFAPADEELAARFLAGPLSGSEIKPYAARLVAAIRERPHLVPDVEAVLHAYSLSTAEGLALMSLAEALLRVPDNATSDLLIADKLRSGDWSRHAADASTLMTALGWTLGVSARVVASADEPEDLVMGAIRRVGLPAVRTAARQMMRLLGTHFVLGETIDAALARAADHQRYRYSFDMLGEGARTAADARRYFAAYAEAIEAVGAQAAGDALPARPGVSVKLSALHPRYEPLSRDRVLAELTPKVIELAALAKRHDLNLTIDAEEADRLELSLEVIDRVLTEPSLAGWEGFGLAVQAYQKRAVEVLSWIEDRAAATRRTLSVRLVKGAYWDTEIKRAQERGLADYPVFTRKAMTDMSYEVCARRLLAARPRLYPQFATHNAVSVATMIAIAGGVEGFEFQRLQGMGDTLYEALLADHPDAACRIYAPVGGHKDLLAYLVRRLLENGANSSFVAQTADAALSADDLLKTPRELIGSAEAARHPKLPFPRDLYQPGRKGSSGVEFGSRLELDALLEAVKAARLPSVAAPLVDGVADSSGRSRPVISPIDGAAIGSVHDLTNAQAARAVTAALKGFPSWNAMPVAQRAAMLDRAADLIEQRRGSLIALLQREGGKTLDDALAEVRETADFCRYYAAEARKTLAPRDLPGPTGESNELRTRGRGVFVCISPWNFPLAIFAGQVAAALVAGNTVIAKPAEQTPLIAAVTVGLLHEAGIPVTALHLVPGDGRAGAALTADPRIAGVAFTGSTEVARVINRTLAAKDGPIVPLIAETGGINAMIVDATALPEQVTDDVIASAFRSAGQRCSALRLLCVQDEVADHLIAMIQGAAAELVVGDPRDIGVQVGPVIDAEAKDKLGAWIAAKAGAVRFRWDAGRKLPAQGAYVPPTIIELAEAGDLDTEVFGPVLHVARWRAGELDKLVDRIVASNYALTLGVQSRIDHTVERIVRRVPHGNVYINRNMIGAVVGTQPFGGSGLSGTGPKAGGPHYLARFCAEQTVTENTAAAGGNASLLTQID
ncbi:MAG: bifunctional proline dehydrogenase/L-glutamate gamma-semialdehyde dehydrogenase PutA [Pseudolabrys sp.]